MTELWQMSGLALGKAIASREVSAVEVLDAIVARVEAVNPRVNAVVTLVAERAREERVRWMHASPQVRQVGHSAVCR